MQGSTQDPIHHAEGDVWVHTRMVTEELLALPAYQEASPEDQFVLFATALLHDVAKPVTRREEEGGRITNRGHSRIGAIMAREILWRMGCDFRLRERICTLIAFHQIPFWLIEREEWSANRIVTEISLSVENHLLGIFAEADAKGRICADLPGILDNIELFRETARYLDCLNAPYRFASDHARVRYFRDPENRSILDAPFDTTDPAFEVIVMSGMPGSGKSTHATSLGLPIVSLDALRQEMDVDPEDPQGGVVQAARERAKVHLRRKEPFIWDATNMNREMRGLTIPMLLDYGARVKIVYVEGSVADVTARNSARGRGAVPDAAITRMLRRWEPPALVEAHSVTNVLT